MDKPEEYVDVDVTINPELAEQLRRKAPAWTLRALLHVSGLPEAAIPYIEAQRADCRGGDVLGKYVALIEAELEQLMPYLPERHAWGEGSPLIFADIGCGAGGMAAALAEYFGAADSRSTADIRVHLIDRDGSTERPKYGYCVQPPPGSFYNSLDLARCIVSATGATVAATMAPPDGKAAIPAGDGTLALIVSTLAMGFHFPWTQYRDEILRTLDPMRGVLILDVRRGSGQIEGLLEDFAFCGVVTRGRKHQRLALRLR